MSEGTFNPARRRLCPDGACIGVLGDDGRCRVCGHAQNSSDAGTANGVSASSAVFGNGNRDGNRDGDGDGDGDDDVVDDTSLIEDRDEDVRLAGADLGGASPGGFRPDRRLCDDGSCVGVIGAGDVCSVCGRAAGG